MEVSVWEEIAMNWPLIVAILLIPVGIMALNAAGYNIGRAHAKYQQAAWDHLIDELNKRNEEERRHQRRRR